MSENTLFPSNPTYDDHKNAQNIQKHDMSFEAIHRMEWRDALTDEDTRKQYGESRYITIAPIEGRLHVLVWTVRDCIVRPISLRKANLKEKQYYEHYYHL
jgi:uncharacterized protein